MRKIEQSLYESLKRLPKEERKVATKLVEKINKLKGKIAMKYRSVMFDRRYNSKGVFSESNLRYDKMKQELVDLEDKLNKCVKLKSTDLKDKQNEQENSNG